MATIDEQIAELEKEIANTKKNKATEAHIGKIKAKLLVVPGDGVVIAMAAPVRKLDFRKLKLLTDSSMVIIAAVISLCAVSYLTGAREGSIFAAIAISNFLWFFRNRLGKYIDRFLGDETGARASRDRDRPPRRLPAASRCADRVRLW